jgi:outer membrane biosynthesis protein TonB
MLRLLRKGLANHNQTFLTILYLCAGAHVLLSFVACFIQRNDTMRITMNVPAHARVICMPAFMASATTTKFAHKTRCRMPATSVSSRPQKIQQALLKKSVVQKKPKTTALVASKPLQKVQKKSLAKTAPKPEQKKLEQKIVEEPPVQKKAETQESEVVDEPIYVTADAYQLIGIARELQTAIAEHWAPPAGMPSGLLCQVRVTVNQEGKATQLEVLEKSGVAVFDMAARTALLAIEYPPAVRGKTVVVDFNEDFL